MNRRHFACTCLSALTCVSANPAAGDYELQIGGSRNPQTGWVNGVKVWEGRRNNGFHPNADRVVVRMNKGRNEIVGTSNFMRFVGVKGKVEGQP